MAPPTTPAKTPSKTPSKNNKYYVGPCDETPESLKTKRGANKDFEYEDEISKPITEDEIHDPESNPYFIEEAGENTFDEDTPIEVNTSKKKTQDLSEF